MDKEFIEIKEKLIKSVFKIKHLGVVFHHGMDTQMKKHEISMTEYTLMKKIKDNILDSEINIGISEIQKHLCITKAAVSKMLGVLEKKGYVNREINKSNRRTLTVTLTPGGREIIDRVNNDIDNMLIEIIRRLDKFDFDIEQFIVSINKFTDVTSEVIE